MSNSSFIWNTSPIAADTPGLDTGIVSTNAWKGVVGVLALILVLGALFEPAFPFSSDGAIHIEMVRAFVDSGAFHIATNGGVDGAPALLNVTTHEFDGAVYPQYPSGYGVAGAPFYSLFGMRGLVLLNAFSAVGVLVLTFYITRVFYNRLTAQLAVLVLAFGTFFWNYAFAIWPHMLALFVWMLAAALAVRSDIATTRKTQLGSIALCGLIIGFGTTVRVDIVLAIPAIFVWLRLFARPTDRLSAIAFLTALIPGMLIAAALNEVKFGFASPLYYGDKPGHDGLSNYLWLLPILAVTTLIGLVVNVPKLVDAANQKIPHQFRLAGIGIITIALIGLLFGSGLHTRITQFAYNFYVLVVDLQGYNSEHIQLGVERNASGHLLFWNIPKPALLQSLPFATLALLPAIEFFRGKSVKFFSLAALIIFAPICFYAINQWHGGGAYNIRYFVPTLPFISILSAAALQKLAARESAPKRQSVIAALAAGAICFTFAEYMSKSSDALFVPWSVYPQLVMAFALGLMVTLIGMRPEKSKKLAHATLLCSVAIIAYASMSSLTDQSSQAKGRGESDRLASIMADALPDNALVLSMEPGLFLKAQENGVSVYYVDENTLNGVASAVEAFEHANRCVYFHIWQRPHLIDQVIAPDRLTPTNLKPVWVQPGVPPRWQLLGLDTQIENCHAT